MPAKKKWTPPANYKPKHKIEDAIKKIMDVFESGNLPEALAHSFLSLPKSMPCARWKGYTNRIIWWCMTTMAEKHYDCRTFKQWKTVGRIVSGKGTGFALWKPNPFQPKGKDGKLAVDSDGNAIMRVSFRPFIVFSYDDTKPDPNFDGEPYEPTELEPQEPPPLMDRAKAMGLKISYTPFSGVYYGAYSPGMELITLATHDESTFFHELAHHAHKLVVKERGIDMKSGQDPFQEAVAELSAATLCILTGRKPTEGRSHKYIKAYAEKVGMTATEICKNVLKDVEDTLHLILDDENVKAEKASRTVNTRNKTAEAA